MKTETWKKGLKYWLILNIFCLLLFLSRTETFAAVTEAEAGDTVYGEYAVIVNTSTTTQESTGTLVFDGDESAVAGSLGLAVKNSSGQNLVFGKNSAVKKEAAPSSYEIGTEKTIAAVSGGSQTYVCIGEGEHCYIWMSKPLKATYDSAGKTDAIAKDMARTYDGVPYETLSEMAGGTIPCLDGTGKLSILLETLSGASGVYKSDYGMTAIHINAPEAASYQFGTMESRNGLLVHEGQHALFHLMTNFDTTQLYTWLNEGFAVAAMDYIWGGTDSSGWLDGIAGNAEIRNGSSLFYSSYRDSSARDYGMPYLFVRYLIAQKTKGYNPMELFPLFYQQNAGCTPDAYVEKLLGESTRFADFLTDFYTAVIAQESSGAYGFWDDPIVFEKVKNYPIYMGSSGTNHMLPPTGAIVIRLKNGTFTVPADGGSSIRYRIIEKGKNVSKPSSGDGSSQNPYQITTYDELKLIGIWPDANYRLESDLVVDESLNLTITNFRGVLDGNGHAVRGLKRPLVGRNSGTIRNLTVEADLRGEYVGTQGIFAQINEGLIADCVAKGQAAVRMIRGQSSFEETAFGGIAGTNHLAGSIRGCGFTASASVELPPVKSWIGGIAGIQLGTVEKCYSKGSLTVLQPEGSVHTAYVPSSNDSYEVYAGGIAGEIRKQGAFGGSISDCVHLGSLLVNGGNQAVGQICGLVNQNVINSVLGLSGHLSSCYAKQGTAAAIGYPTGQSLEEEILLSEEAVKNQDSYQGWDFVGEWKMDTDGPVRLGADDIKLLTAKENPTYCYVGEKPYNWGALQVNGAGRIQITQDMIFGFDSKTAGIVLVGVSYLGKTTDFSMEIREPQTVTELRAASNKNKIYQAGESFDPSTVYLLATIDGKSNRIIYGGFDYDKKDPLTRSDTSVRLSYYGASVEYPITVQEKEVSSITVLQKMDATDYEEGQKLDLSEIRVQITYSNGEKSPIFGREQFEEYRIHAAKSLGSGIIAIEKDAVLTLSDDNAAILLYVGDTLPGNYGAVSALAGTVTVREKLNVPEMILHLVSGREALWLITDPITGGSGQYSSQVVEENLPSGISRVRLPEGGYGYFEYRGTTSVPAGSVYKSTYRITDVLTGRSVIIEVTLQIHAKNEASFFQFDLLKRNNPELKKDVIGIIGNDSIVLKVLEGTDVSHFIPTIEFGYSMGVTLPQQFWNGTSHDFTTPVIYELTAPDGETKKQYTVSVEFVSELEEETPPPDETEKGDKNTEQITTPQEEIPVVGTVVLFGKAYYRVTADSGDVKTVELKGLVKKKTKSFKIPAVIKVGAEDYRVTAIGKRAFYKNSYLKKLIVGKYVTSIGKEAFKNCKNLRTLTFKGKKLSSVGKNALKGICKTAVIHVPKRSRKAYKKLFINCKKNDY